MSVCMYVCMYVCPNFGVAYLKIGDSCDLEIFLWALCKIRDARLFIYFLISRDLRGLRGKRSRQMLLKTHFLNIWGQIDEKKLYLVWRDKSTEIKFTSKRSSQQGIKGLKLIPFAKNHYSALLRSNSWKETISNMTR